MKNKFSILIFFFEIVAGKSYRESSHEEKYEVRMIFRMVLELVDHDFDKATSLYEFTRLVTSSTSIYTYNLHIQFTHTIYKFKISHVQKD